MNELLRLAEGVDLETATRNQMGGNFVFTRHLCLSSVCAYNQKYKDDFEERYTEISIIIFFFIGHTRWPERNIQCVFEIDLIDINIHLYEYFIVNKLK